MHNENSMLETIKEDQTLLERLVELTQKECFRPKLDHLKIILKDDISSLENEIKKIVVIGGTNGKGETAHCLKYLLEKGGGKVALWTSPHVVSLRERIYNQDFIRAEELSSLIDRYGQDAKKHDLSFYEFFFYLFVKYLKEKTPEYLVLEVGLGGRFDAVNLFSNPLTAIVSISRDHTEILGESLKGILFEKYGITRTGGSLISAVEQGNLVSLLKEWTQRDNIEFNQLSFDDEAHYFERNRAVAKALYFQIKGESFKGEEMWPESKGRREKVTFEGRNFIFIGAHNLDGHRKMLKYLYSDNDFRNQTNNAVISFSTGREKQIPLILELYRKYPCLFEQCYLSNFEGDRAISEDELEGFGCDEFIFIKHWKRFLSDDFKNKNIIITGSYFFIAKFQEFLFSHSR